MDTLQTCAPFFFVTGGCRSGKSAYALRAAAALAPRGLFLATAAATDEEMRERIRLHQEERAELRKKWRTHELAPADAPELASRLPALVRTGEVLLLDCLSLWTASCLEAGLEVQNFAQTCGRLMKGLRALPGPVVLVSNEVGLGLTPSTPLGRRFRDCVGLANQSAAGSADTVILMVSGLPLALKGAVPKI